MNKVEARKLNDKIQAIYEKPLYEMSVEEMDKAVIDLIIRTFDRFKEQEQSWKNTIMKALVNIARYAGAHQVNINVINIAGW